MSNNKRKIKATPIPFSNSIAIHWEDEENVTEVLATTENAEFAEAMVELFNEK